MRWQLLTLCLLLASSTNILAHGLLIPEDKKLPPLAMIHHRVNIAIEDQVAITTVEQSFRNHTDRALEATYIFPVPKDANVKKFSMWVNGTEQNGELLDAKKASDVYTSIVRQTQDPAILEYIGNNLMRLKIFPVEPKGDAKVKLSFTSIAPKEGNVVEYIYPLKTDGKATKTLEEFSIQATLKSQHPIQSVYSPTHAINIVRKNDRDVSMQFERNQAILDKDFQLFYSVGSAEIGITTLMHRPISNEDGYFLLLISPQLESSKNTVIPRDLVLVLDTSGSMDAVKMDQARKALNYCLENLRAEDRFGIISFSTAVRKYRDSLVEANSEQVEQAKKWVDQLKAGGGTAIQSALDAAQEMRTKDEARAFTMVFFTDGQPTIGEMKPENILRNVASKNTSNTRIFTFGVGDDVNAAMLDKLAESTRAVSTYVRPSEDIQTKVAGLYGKISHPVLANVRLHSSENIKFYEIYPTQLPDLFYGSQLIVLGKYSGHGAAAIKLLGQVGKETREFAYDVSFASKTTEDKDFVEHLWARRKVGYLLDQIRINGEQKELMEEMVTLAKKYGIATPYTSYLVVPDAPLPVVSELNRRGEGSGKFNFTSPDGLGQFGGGKGPMPSSSSNPTAGDAFGRGGFSTQKPNVEELAKKLQKDKADGEKNRSLVERDKLTQMENELEQSAKKEDRNQAEQKQAETFLRVIRENQSQIKNYEQARQYIQEKRLKDVNSGSVGVDWAVCANNLRAQDRLTPTANRIVNGRNCLEIGGIWIDDTYSADMKAIVVKAQSDAYFKILERQKNMKDVFRLGNYLVYVTPSKVALIIDSNNGKDKLTDEEIDSLFIVAKK